MFKKLYDMMDSEEKEDYRRLLVFEINANLAKIYRLLKPKPALKPQKVRKDDIVLKHVSLAATKMWEFKPDKKPKAARGDVGRIIVATRGLRDEAVRKQRALFIAAEFYVYHAFANHHDARHYKSIKGQNQYWDTLKSMFHARNAHDTRDRAIRYIIEEIGEHKLAHYRGKGWYVRISRLKEHDAEIARMIGSSEKTFKEIVRKQHQAFSPDMLKQEEDLIRKEIEDIEHLAALLKKHENKKGPEKKLVDIHIADLNTFSRFLKGILNNIHKWEIKDRKEHKRLKSRSDVSRAELKKLLKQEAEAEKIDINNVHLVFHHFKKEKINILRDLELLEDAGVKSRKRR